MTDLKFNILHLLRDTEAVNCMHLGDLYNNLRSLGFDINEAKRALSDLTKAGFVRNDLTDKKILWIDSIGRIALESEEEHKKLREEDLRRWRITTAISVIALILSVISIAVAVWTAQAQLG